MKSSLGAGLLLFLLAAATACTFMLHGSPRIGVDDANITFSYAENLAAGRGLTYGHNGERVEGFTSFLWLLLCAASFALGTDETGVYALSFALLAATLLLLHRAIRGAARAESRTPVVSHIIFAALILCSPGYITWMTITLMDTVLWGFVIAWMCASIVEPPRTRLARVAAAIPFALAPLTRPEALFIGPVFLLLLLARMRSCGIGHAARTAAWIGAGFLITATALIAFRLAYFGHPLPNTYYAKVAPSLSYNLWTGKNYLFAYLSSGVVPLLLSAFVLIGAVAHAGGLLDRLRRRERLRAVSAPGLTHAGASGLAALALLLVPVLTGGDHFGMFRPVQPAYPLLCLAPVLYILRNPPSFLDAISSRSWWRAHAVAGGTVAVMLAYFLVGYSSQYSWIALRWGFSLAAEFRLAEAGVVQGRAIARVCAGSRPMPRIGVIAAGGVARGYPGPIVDLMGLNNEYIAHSPGDRKGGKNHAAFEREAFFHLAPDVLLAAPPVPPDSANKQTIVLKGLHRDPRFTAAWRFGTLMSPDRRDSLTAFIRAGFLAAPGGAALAARFRETMIWRGRWVPVAGM
jgi:arabinofuranosyltransferase